METPAQIRDKGIFFKELSKKVTTVNIGAISQFETYFGILWGHGKYDHELTETEREWRDIWNDCRKMILDNGNSQLRLVQQLLNRYDLKSKPQVIEVGNMVNGKYEVKKHPMILEDK